MKLTIISSLIAVGYIIFIGILIYKTPEKVEKEVAPTHTCVNVRYETTTIISIR